MKISGFTIARNAIKFHYPLLESIQSILPICDEFVVNVGDSEDGTLRLIELIKNPKIKIIQNKWDMSMGKEVLSYQTNLALKECRGDWAFYLQSDEVIHQSDLSKLKNIMIKNLSNSSVDALRFKWLHFYGSYYRYRIDAGWYQKQDRIIRNNGEVESYGDAYSFHRKDGKVLRSLQTDCLLYHYGWVHSNQIMAQRRTNAEQIGFVALKEDERKDQYHYGNLNRFPIYFGSHPQRMDHLVKGHQLSVDDWKQIARRQFWNPLLWTRARFKTGKRVKEKIN